MNIGHAVQRKPGATGNDWLIGDDDNNTLLGLSGNDKIFGFGGDDTLDGGIGDDTLDGGVGNDFLVGGSGNDRLIDKNGDGTLDGGEGSDFIEITNGHRTVFGGTGEDYIVFDGSVEATVSGGDDNDWLFLNDRTGNQNVTIDGGAGHDVLQFIGASQHADDIDWSKVTNVEEIHVLSETDWILTIDDSMFNGTSTLTVVADKLGGFGSASALVAFDGSAVTAGSLKLVGIDHFKSSLTGGARDDILMGLTGSDALKGGGGSDTIDGGDGDDIAIFSGNLADYKIEYDFENGFVTVTDLVGGDGADLLTNIEKMQFADQLAYVEVGGAVFNGTAGRDVLRGTDGGDKLFAKGGDDVLVGNWGIDTIEGGAGDDVLLGGRRGDEKDDFLDVLLGGAGKDQIRDLGDSWIDGGDGDDSIYVSNGSHSVSGGEGNDRIGGSDFVGTVAGGSGNDRLLVDYFSGLLVGDGGNDFMSVYGAGDVSLYGGDGDDAIYASGSGTFVIDAGGGNDIINFHTGNASTVDGGEGVDALSIYSGSPQLWLDWASITGVEQVKFDITYNQIDVLLGDSMFVNQDAWRIDASDQESRPSNYHYVRVDGSTVTAGQLTLIGNDDRVSTLIGGARDDALFGLMADDELTGGAGNDRLDGGGGSDVAVFSGNIADYTIVYDNSRGTATVTDNVGDDGTDTVANVEKFQFADAEYDVLLPGSTIRGTGGNDRLVGTDGTDRILGLGGNDQLSGSDLHDYLDGGAGNDTLVGGDDDDTLLGGAGSDTLRDFKGNGYLHGGGGNDRIITDSGLQTIFGGDGADLVSTGRIDGTIDGGIGDDHIITLVLNDLVVLGGEGSDVIEFGSRNNYSVDGGGGDDLVWVKYIYQADGLIDGGDGYDILQVDGSFWQWDQIQNFERIRVAGSGNPYYFAASNAMFASRSEWVVDLASPDKAGVIGHSLLDGREVTNGRLIFIGGDASHDTLFGGALDDQLFGKAGDDSFYGRGGDDTIDGGAGSDVAGYYGNFDDFIIAYDSATGKVTVTDTVGEQGTDSITGVELLSFFDRNYALPIVGRSFNGTAVDDKISGTEGNDTIFGLAGDDMLSGGVAHDLLDGGKGNDRLFGNEGTDTLIGGEGNDALTDLEGDGTFDGGGGMDRIFVKGLWLTVSGGDGDDLISVKSIVNEPFSLPESILVDGGAGSDVIEIYGSSDATVHAGEGDDQIDIRSNGGFAYLYGGDGVDAVLVLGPSLPWNHIFNVENILVDTVIYYNRFKVNDDLFENQDHWVIKGLRQKGLGSGDEVWIDASDVTVGALSLVGLNKQDDTLIGGALGDEISGLSGDDYLSGRGGYDIIDGGLGVDTAVFVGEIEDYTITVDELGVVTVTDNEGTDGIDTLKNIEMLRFLDETYTL